jgi:peptidyl-prolyl cis-trans isomerase C
MRRITMGERWVRYNVFLIYISIFISIYPCVVYGDIIAKVGNKSITLKDLDDFLRMIPKSQRIYYHSEVGKRDMLENMIDWKLLSKEAIKMGLDKDPGVLVKLNRPENQLQILREATLAGEFIQRNLNNLTDPKEDEVKNYYNHHQEEFRQPEQVRLRRIFVRSEKEAQEIFLELKKGESFEKISKEKSKEGAAKKGGDLGWFSIGKMDKTMEKIALTLKPGEFSKIVKSPTGYYLIQVVEKKPSFMKSFEEAKDRIKTSLKNRHQQEMMEKLKADLRSKVKISINESMLKGYEWKEESPENQ